MKKIITTLSLTLALIGQNLQGAENYKTLVCNAATPTVTYNVPAGELCHVMYVYLTSPAVCTATISGTVFDLRGVNVGNQYNGVFAWQSQNQSKEPKSLMIAGPATITLTRSGIGDNFCTLRLIPTPNVGGVKQ
jgi:hypothetical protein